MFCLKSLHLSNFCQHSKKHIQFEPGVNILTGENGSGKSNILRAIQFALFGSIPNTKNLEENIKYSVDSNESPNATVTLEFEADGCPCKVSRTIKSNSPNSASLKVGQEEEIKQATKVNNKIEELCGCTESLASKFAIIHQNCLTDLFDSSNANRKKLLQELFGVDHLYNLGKNLKTELDRFTEVIEPDQTPEQVSSQIEEKQEIVNDIDNKLENISSKVDDSKIEDLRHRKFKAQRAKQYKDELEQILAKLNEENDSLEEIKVNLSNASNRVSDLTTQFNNLSDQASKAKVDIENLDNIKRLNSQISSLKSRIQSTQDQLDKSQDPGTPEDPTELLESSKQERDRLSEKIWTAEQFLSSFEGGSGSCPTCGTEAIVDGEGHQVDVTDKINEYKEVVIQCRPKYNEVVELIDEVTSDYNKKLKEKEQYDSWVRETQKTISDLKSQLSELGDIQEEPDVTKSKELVEECNKLQQDLEEAKQNYKSLSEKENNIQFNIDSLNDKYNTKKEYIDSHNEDIDKLQEELSSLETLKSNRDALSGRREELVSYIETLKERKKEVEKAVEKAKNQRAYKKLLTEARTLLHQDNLPSHLSKPFVDKINKGWNDMLEMLNQPFSAQLISRPGTEEDLNLYFHLPDAVLPAYQLSGGQKCAASLSFLVEVNRLFASNLGFLILDEPTYGLSESKLELLPDFIRSVQTYAQRTGMQLIISTHVGRLFNEFDNVISITS